MQVICPTAQDIFLLRANYLPTAINQIPEPAARLALLEASRRIWQAMVKLSSQQPVPAFRALGLRAFGLQGLGFQGLQFRGLLASRVGLWPAMRTARFPRNAQSMALR
jgi:hypothetical protein